MNEIKDFQFESIPVAATRELLHELYETSEGSDYVKTEMSGVYTPWKQAYEVMAHVYELPLGNVEATNMIFSLDSRRDMAFKAFEIYVKLAKESGDAEMVAAAEAMERTMTSFPVNINTGYLTQTAQMDSFLAVVLGEQLEATTKIGALKLVQDMKQFNDEIHALVASRDVLRVERDALPTRPEARLAAIERWRFLAKYANSIVTINYDGTVPEGLNSFIELVNKKWERYESIYLGGSGSNKPGSGSGESSDDSENSESSEGSEGSETLDPALNIKIVFKNQNNQLVHEMVVPVDYQIPESEFPTPPEGTHWNFTLADLNLAIGMKNPGDTITVRAQA